MKSILQILAAFVAIILIISSVTGGVKLLNQNEYTVTVVDKETKKDDNKSKYLIFTELEDGTTKVFQNTDELVKFKFNSSDIYAGIKIGETYTFKTIGWRVPFLSMYENIIEVE